MRARRAARILVDVPELNVAFFSFLLHFVWEMWQVPFFAYMPSTAHWTGVSICTRATLGDSAMAVLAFWAGAAPRRTRSWFLGPKPRELSLYLGAGLALTVAFEWLGTGPLERWTYGPEMPRVPLLGTGLLPILQWLFLPPSHCGSRRDSSGEARERVDWLGGTGPRSPGASTGALTRPRTCG